ncbi:MAG: Fe2+-dependent dioxygenase [Pseudomonadota bacterium]|nr:Fe2+-dependent dioxygenase [Pseudomonadota bacterium]
MMLHIPTVLTAAEVRDFRGQLDVAQWSDGRATVGAQGAQVKHNQQLDPALPVAQSLSRRILERLQGHSQFFSAALPLRILPPLFNRYAGGGQYGLHVDGAVMNQRDTRLPLRSDVSATLFLCDPDEYDGGELVVKDTYGEHEAKLPAGDLLLYPSTSLHQVLPVTRGARVCAFFWVQSMVREDSRRTMLYELDQAIQGLRGRLGEAPECVALTAHYHNLLRLWAEV